MFREVCDDDDEKGQRGAWLYSPRHEKGIELNLLRSHGPY
jgi:hypothetical protein